MNKVPMPQRHWDKVRLLRDRQLLGSERWRIQIDTFSADKVFTNAEVSPANHKIPLADPVAVARNDTDCVGDLNGRGTVYRRRDRTARPGGGWVRSSYPRFVWDSRKLAMVTHAEPSWGGCDGTARHFLRNAYLLHKEHHR